MNHDRNALLWLTGYWKYVVLFLVFVSLGSLVFGADCIADGSPDFREGARAWCNSGLYERVHVDFNDDTLYFNAYVVLNEIGYQHWQVDEYEVKYPYMRMLMDMAQAGVKVGSRVQFRHGGDVLKTCTIGETETDWTVKCEEE